MKKIKILLAFDHELPLGGVTEDYNKAIFDPTNKLLELSEDIDVKINLLTDVLSGYMFKNWDFEGFYVPYCNQLKETILQKHDVQLHIHPHWLTSTFNSGSYLPSKHFRLADFINSGKYSVDSIIKIGKSELTSICKEVDSDYKCIAYRAGGFNLEPDGTEIVKALKSNDIFIDSSIPKGMYFKSDVSELNYKGFDKKANWFLNPATNFRDTTLNQGVFEIPVATSPSSIFYLMKHSINKTLHPDRKPLTVGRTIHHGKTDIKNKIISLTSVKLLGFDVYTYNGKDLLRILDWHVNNNTADKNDEIIVSTVSHPKNMGTYSLQLMRDFVNLVREKYKENVQFCTYREIYDSLSGTNNLK